MDGGRQIGRAVDHRGVHYLAFAGSAAFEQGGDDTESQEHRAAAEVADQIERRYRGAVFPPDRAEHAGEGDVVDIVSRARSFRSFLTEAGHPAVDKFWICRETFFGTEAEPFHGAGPEPFDQHVGLRDQFFCRRHGFRLLQVERDRFAATPQHVETRIAAEVEPEIASCGTVDPNDLCPHVGEQHRAKRRWPDAGHLHHAQTIQRTHWRPRYCYRPVLSGNAGGFSGLFIDRQKIPQSS